MLKFYLVQSYATLIRSGMAILNEEERTEENQRLIPLEYQSAVANYLAEKFG